VSQLSHDQSDGDFLHALAGVGGRSTTLSTCLGELFEREREGMTLVLGAEAGCWMINRSTSIGLMLTLSCLPLVAHDAAKCLGEDRGEGTPRGGDPT
jgi:hypothetical protein